MERMCSPWRAHLFDILHQCFVEVVRVFNDIVTNHLDIMQSLREEQYTGEFR